MSLTEVIAEQWLARRLQMPRDWDAGVTTTSERRERIRLAILKKNLQHERAGWRSGHPETWAQLYQRLFRQPVEPAEILRDAV